MTVVSIQQQEFRTKFDEFWNWYPLKKGKPKARALFDKITSDGGLSTRTLCKDSGTYLDIHLEATPDELIDGAEKLFRSLIPPNQYTPDTTYCPHPTTWLNQGRWEDE